METPPVLCWGGQLGGCGGFGWVFCSFQACWRVWARVELCSR